MTFGGFCFTETKERELMFARTSYYPCIQSNVPMCIMGGWMGCWGVYICKCLAQIRRRHREEMFTGLLSACADSPVTADMNMPLYYTKHKEKPTDITVWKILSFHCQIQLTLKAPIPLDSQHDAMTPKVRMTDYYFQHVYYFITRVCALTHTHRHAILCLSLPPSWNACAMMLSAKLWLLITRQIDFINHSGNRSSVMSSGSAISQKSSMKNSAQQAFYQAIYLIYRPASCQKQLPNNRLIKHEIYWATAA